MQDNDNGCAGCAGCLGIFLVLGFLNALAEMIEKMLPALVLVLIVAWVMWVFEENNQRRELNRRLAAKERQEELERQRKLREAAARERQRQDRFKRQLQQARSLARSGETEAAQRVLGRMSPVGASEKAAVSHTTLDVQASVRTRQDREIADATAKIGQLRRDLRGRTIGKNRQ